MLYVLSQLYTSPASLLTSFSAICYLAHAAATPPPPFPPSKVGASELC